MTGNARLMRWMNLYDTGIDSIDRQHENLTELLNAMNEAWRANKSREVMLFRLDQFIAAVSEHFHEEELGMEAKNYPDLDLHSAEHKFLLAQAKQFRDEYSAQQIDMSESMLDYLRDWLRDHILISDRRMARFLLGDDPSA
jgi:hemerythrin-like metal-binding protein